MIWWIGIAFNVFVIAYSIREITRIRRDLRLLDKVERGEMSLSDYFNQTRR